MNDTTITFCGWVGSDVTSHQVGVDNQLATFRVASTPRRLRQGQWEDLPTAWYTVKTWRSLAANVHHSVRRGDPVIITGRLEIETWTRPSGETSIKHVVQATAVGFDLNRGTGAFARPRRDQQSAQQAQTPRQPLATDGDWPTVDRAPDFARPLSDEPPSEEDRDVAAQSEDESGADAA